jgi:hypothetical protein
MAQNEKAIELSAAGFGLRYGELEDLTVLILGGHREKVITRFRKLRPKFAPDMLLSSPGVRVNYDLPRVLSIAAVFLVNSTGVPLAKAVDLVIANFPELARGCLLTWKAADTGDDADRSRFLINIHVDGFDDEWEKGAYSVSWASNGPIQSEAGAHIVVDCLHVVHNLVVHQEATGRRGSLAEGFDDLSRTYGWVNRLQGEAPVLPRRLGSSFFSTGPYFARARAILAHSPDQPISKARRALLQSHLNYIEWPPPIDAWKGILGTEHGAPQLRHLLAVWGLELGLQSSIAGTEVMKDVSFPSDVRASALISGGEQMIAELVEVEVHRD